MKIKKRNGLLEEFDENKIINAISKSADRVSIPLTKEVEDSVINFVKFNLYKFNLCKLNQEICEVKYIHSLVERALDLFEPEVAKSYKDYRNYKMEYGIYLMNDMESQIKKTLEEVDRDNSNSNTRYISTKRTEIAQIFSKEMYQKMYLSKDVLSAMKDGYIYVHDLKDMLLPQFNCTLCDYKSILDGGFELEGIKYTEPKDIRTAVGQIGDVLQIISAQHFGGHTIPEIDKVLEKYYKLSIEKEIEYAFNVASSINGIQYNHDTIILRNEGKNKAYRELKQSLQGFEIKMNTVVSARGSYPSIM